MPAYFDTGFFVRQPAWHGQGNVLDDYPESWAAARPLAGLDWDPIEERIFRLDSVEPDTGRPVYAEIEDRKAIVRSDNGNVLSVRQDSYQIISHDEMGEIVDAVANMPGVRYETAGSIEGGKGVWALALLDEPVTLPGDDTLTLPYLALLNRHDGKGAMKVLSTNVRVVCANTWKAAEMNGERDGTVFSFRHTAGWRDRIEEARAAVSGVRDSFAEYVAEATDLLGITVTPRQRELFVREFIPTPPDGLVSDRVARNIEEARAAVRLILESKTTEHVSGTAYGLAQAAGEYLDHVRAARTWETRLNRSLLRPEPLKTKAVRLAREAALA
jgi:phage/plasmid-like protein (TIGR03299 family)